MSAPAKPPAEPPAGYRPGVGVVLFNAEGLVFAGRRSDVRGEAWQMPQGGIDPGEDPRAAALRELAEETGTDRASVVDRTEGWLVYDLPAPMRGRWRGRWRGQAQLWFLARFTGTDADIDIAADGHPEFDAWRWMPLAELARGIVGFKRGVYDALVEAFAARIEAEARRSG